jgi:hypothetical protein
MLLGRGLPPVVGTAGALLENSGLEVLPGVELAMGGLFTPTEPYATLVLPVARPLSRRGLDKRIAQAFSDKGLDPVKLGDAWSLDDVGGMDGWWLGTTRGAVLLSTRAELVQEMTDGAGETWIPAETADLAGEPGLWGRADLRGLPFGIPVVATAHLGAPAPGEVALIIDAPGLMDAMTDQLPGLVEDRAGSLGGQVGRAPADDPVGNPRSTEALSVLMLISSREEATLKSGGAYLPYTGGPREVEALDGTAVPWEGIPELDLAPMDAACRYEVRVDHEGWLATAWCDQDADGEPAVLLLRPGGTPIRVSPPGAR